MWRLFVAAIQSHVQWSSSGEHIEEFNHDAQLRNLSVELKRGMVLRNNCSKLVDALAW